MEEKKKVYKFSKIDKKTYEYITEKNVKYYVKFEDTQNRYFTSYCVNCARIFELICLCEDDSTCKDYCSNRTLAEIAADFLSQDFADGFVFKFLDSDNRGETREYLFNKLIDSKLEGDFERFCNHEHVYDEKKRMCLVIKKDIPNFEESKKDLIERCDVCKGETHWENYKK